MSGLFPDLRPYDEGRLAVGDGHSLYYEQCGEPDGLAVLVLHGGPGAGCQSSQRRFFSPHHYRIVLCDQRGAGRSTPHAEIANNTTEHLVQDIERLRIHLGIDKWVLFGGGFGATLALLYAQQFNERVHGLVLRSCFLARAQDREWFFGGGAATLFPDAWAEFARHVGANEHDREAILAGYAERLQGDSDLARMAAARAWSHYAARIRTLNESHGHSSDGQRHFSTARIACHYARHHYFLEENQIIQQAGKLHGLPGIMVHGRFDVVSPLANAWDLQRVWPDSELMIVRGAGHVATEPATTDALVHAAREMYRLITQDSTDLAE